MCRLDRLGGCVSGRISGQISSLDPKPGNRLCGRTLFGAPHEHRRMTLEVEIANIEQTDNTLDVSVFVTTDTTETIDYSLNITDTGTGGDTVNTGTLAGGAQRQPFSQCPRRGHEGPAAG